MAGALNATMALRLGIDFDKSWAWVTSTVEQAGTKALNALFPGEPDKIKPATHAKDLDTIVLYDAKDMERTPTQPTRESLPNTQKNPV